MQSKHAVETAQLTVGGPASIGARYVTKGTEAVRVARVFVLSARSNTDTPNAGSPTFSRGTT